MGLKAGDEILVPSHRHFLRSSNDSFRAKPVFIDIDETYCLDVDFIERRLRAYGLAFCGASYGHPANLDRILDVARKHGLWVIEDWPRRHGARFKASESVRWVWPARSHFFLRKFTVMGDGAALQPTTLRSRTSCACCEITGANRNTSRGGGLQSSVQ